MDWSGYGGLIELSVVLAFALGWGILELLGLRLDKKRAAEKRRLEERNAGTMDAPSLKGAGHPKR